MLRMNSVRAAMSPPQRGHVWLMRARDTSSDGRVDEYERVLEARGYTVHFVPLLGFRNINAALLREALDEGGGSGENGGGGVPALVLTSHRAISALLCCDSDGGDTVFVRRWAHRPVFVLSDKARQRLERLGFTDVRTDATCKSAATLARYAIEECARIQDHDGDCVAGRDGSGDIAGGSRSATVRLLFPCGTKRRGELPALLSAADGIALRELPVYESAPVEQLVLPSVGDQVDTAADGNSVSGGGGWIVFFSPSGVSRFVEHIVQQCGGGMHGSVKLAAIGQTTAAAVKEQLVPLLHATENVTDAATVADVAVAARPTAAALGDALSGVDAGGAVAQ